MEDALHNRLSVLRDRGSLSVAPLWIESLDPAEGLREARGREGPLFRLQEARCLAALGRAAEAREVLDALESLPAGLADIRFEFLGNLGTGGARDPVQDARRAPGGAARPPVAPAEENLELWLQRVRSWRRARRA